MAESGAVMKRLLFGSMSALVLIVAAAQPAKAADLAPYYKAPAPPWSWAGFYVGVHSGAMFSGTKFSDPFGSSIYGDVVDVPGYLAGAQAGYNWVVAPGWIAGLEVDGSFVSSDGSNTCLQFSADFVGSNCRVNTRAMGTFTGRLGFTIGPANRTLIYGKGGLAWIRNDVAIDGANNFFDGFPQSTTRARYTAWGGTVGAGVERALTPAWSLKFEYDYLRFAKHDVATPTSIVVSPAGVLTAVVGPNTTSITQDAHVFKVGLNYKVGADPWEVWPVAPAYPAYPVKGAYKAPPPAWVPGWEVEVGARYWMSSGKYQWDNFFIPNVIESRLTYSRLTGHAGEIFGRVDTPLNVFVKGFIGTGSVTSGRMNDEDWGIPVGFAAASTSYTNTISDPVKGPINYATVDIGFNTARGPGYKAGPFIGYNYYREVLHAYGCAQIANPDSGICAPSVPNSVLAITQTAEWKSLRLGYAGELMLTDRVKVTGDIAYLPYVQFDGRDDHHLRDVPTFFTQWSRKGQGVQTELLFSYFVTPNFNLGAGGRYWAMWTKDGQFNCTGCDGAGVTSFPPNPSKNSTERYGVFFQGSYRFGVGPVVATN